MALTYAGFYNDVIPYASGRGAAGVSVTVKVHGSSTLATLYADRTKAATTSNPVTTDVSGNLTFYADPGLYDCTAPTGTFTVAVPVDTVDVDARVPSTYSGASTLSAPLARVAFTDVPAASDSDLYQVAQTYNGTSYDTRWDNERGGPRAQSRPGSYWDHLFVAIGDPLNDGGTGGDLFRCEAIDGSGNRYGTGGLNRLGRLKTSLSTWTAVTSVDPNTTGRYAAATTSAGAGGAIDALGARWIADDRVELRGQLAATGTAVAGDVMCVLPAGYAPSKPRTLICGASGGAAVAIEITTAGNVVNRRAGSQSYNISLDGLCFSV